MELAYMPVSDTGFWEFESPLGHQFSGCNVSQVDGLLWKQEAAGSKPDTQTIQ
jgi:hypothetical protein